MLTTIRSGAGRVPGVAVRVRFGSGRKATGSGRFRVWEKSVGPAPGMKSCTRAGHYSNLMEVVKN